MRWVAKNTVLKFDLKMDDIVENASPLIKLDIFILTELIGRAQVDLWVSCLGIVLWVL